MAKEILDTKKVDFNSFRGMDLDGNPESIEGAAKTFAALLHKRTANAEIFKALPALGRGESVTVSTDTALAMRDELLAIIDSRYYTEAITNYFDIL